MTSLTSETRIILKKQVAEEKQQQAMALVIMGTVGLEKEKYRLGHTKVLVFVFVQHENDF